MLDEFSRLVELTESRKGVALRDKEYFKTLFKTLLENCPEGSVIFLATCNVYQLDKEAKEKKVQREKEMLQHLKMLKRNCIV